MEKIIRVLVVDDSAYVRKVIKQMLTRSPFIEVVATARNGLEALDMVKQFDPDVVTLDLIMPHMNGIEFLKKQMELKPVPVVIVSIANESGELALEALDAGAIDFIQKPTALATEKIFEVSDELVQKVKTAAGATLSRPAGVLRNGISPVKELDLSHGKALVDIVVVGISTGGPQGLKRVIPELSEQFPAALAVVLHMPLGYTEMYAKALDKISAVNVIEAKEGELVRPGVCLIAPAGRHMTFRRDTDGKIVVHLDARPFDTPHRPSVDVMFQSAAELYRERVLGVVMTGMGSDGMHGASWIKAQGGIIYTESEETCVVYGMPRSVVEAGLSDRVVTLDRMAQAIMEVV